MPSSVNSPTARDSGDALMMIVNEILDFSTIDAAGVELDHRPFNVRTCVDSAFALVAFVAESKALELVAELGPGCPEMVVGDVTRFRQLIVNLLSNAVKFTAAGEVVLTATVEQLKGEDETAVRMLVSVRDTGIGIGADQMHSLFEENGALDSSTTGDYGGTGLGLVISRRLARDGRRSARLERARLRLDLQLHRDDEDHRGSPSCGRRGVAALARGQVRAGCG